MRTKLDRILTPIALASFFALSGCGDDRNSIRRYQVPHEESMPAAATTAVAAKQRTIAAIVPNSGQAWFFKTTGDPAQVQAAADDFTQVVRSIRFEDAEPKWELPEGWTQEAGGQFRFATLRQGAMEISVSQLPLPADDFDGYLLANINRWRRQISLPPVPQSELPTLTRRIELDDRSAIIYDSGPIGDSSPARPQDSPQPSSPVTYEIPDGWQQEGRRPMRLATFTVQRDDREVEIVLSRLGPNAGTLVANVNRWRGQIELPDAAEADINRELKTIEVDGIAASYIQIVSDDTSQVIYAVIVKRPDLTLFVKLTGDRTLAEAESANFEKFARSIRFSS